MLSNLIKGLTTRVIVGSKVDQAICKNFLDNPKNYERMVCRAMALKQYQNNPNFPGLDVPIGIRSRGNSIVYSGGVIDINATIKNIYYGHRDNEVIALPFSKGDRNIYADLALLGGNRIVLIADTTGIHDMVKLDVRMAMDAIKDNEVLSKPGPMGRGMDDKLEHTYEKEVPIQGLSSLAAVCYMKREGLNLVVTPNPFFVDLATPGLPEEIKQAVEDAIMAYNIAMMQVNNPKLVAEERMPAITMEQAQNLAIIAVEMYRDYQLSVVEMDSKEKDDVAKFLAKVRGEEPVKQPDKGTIEAVHEIKQTLDDAYKKIEERANPKVSDDSKPPSP